MLDGILFEKVGLPAASIITDVFEATGHAMAQSWGVPEYKMWRKHNSSVPAHDEIIDEAKRGVDCVVAGVGD